MERPRDMSEFMLESSWVNEDFRGKTGSGIEVGGLSESLKELVVEKPEPLLAFGIYYPLKGMPNLQRYTSKELPH